MGRRTLVTIVEENHVKEILDIIRSSAITNQNGAEGIIVISQVEEMVNS